MKEIIKDLKNIVSDIEYYKNKREFVRFLNKINNIINNKDEDLAKNIVNEFITKIENQSISEEKLKNIEKIIFGFLLRNERAYISKTELPEASIYEYKTYYSVYIKDKKINIKDYISDKFNNLSIKSISIDSVKWKKIENLTAEDIKKAKTIKIDINKSSSLSI